MTGNWLFSAAAVGLLLLAMSIDRGHYARAPAPQIDPRTQLASLIEKAGLEVTGQQSFFFGEEVLEVNSVECPLPVKLHYIPMSKSENWQAQQLAAHRTDRRVIVYQGQVIEGSVRLSVMPRVFWSKLLVALRLKGDDPWARIVLHIHLPDDCQAPVFDWTQLEQPEIG